MPAEYRYNPEDWGNWIQLQQALPLVYLQIEPCRNISCPAGNVALSDLAQCARPRYNPEDIFAVISILLQVSRFFALPYKIPSVFCSHFTCPARPCLCKVAGDVQASCSTICSLSSLKSIYQSLCGITKFDYPELEYETGHWGREITLCEVTKRTTSTGRESASWRSAVAQVHAFATLPWRALSDYATSSQFRW